jgi:sn-glycerol 3-phosphate transport system ATP-binding protein
VISQHPRRATPLQIDAEMYKWRHLIENFFCKLKEFKRIAMRAEIRRLHRRLGATSIFVTHDQTEAMTLADRLVVMNGGRVEQVGTPEVVYHHPVSRFVAGFVGTPAMNLLEGTINDEGVFVYDQSRKIALPRERAAPLKGKRVVLGMRAEAARLVAPDAPGALTATADFIEELGASRVVHADFDGLPFAVALTEAVKVKSGDPIGIAIIKYMLILMAIGILILRRIVRIRV